MVNSRHGQHIEAPTQTLKAVEGLVAIEGSQVALEGKMDLMAIKKNHLWMGLCKVDDRTTAVEDDVDILKQKVKELKGTVSGLKCSAIYMEECLEDAERRSRCPSAELFLEDWLVNTLKPQYLCKFLMVEQARRVLAALPRPEVQPRPIIAQLFNYRDQDVFLHHVHGPPRFEDMDIFIYPYYTHRVQDLGKNFLPIKELLRDHNIKYSLMYPAKLRVEYEFNMTAKLIFINLPKRFTIG
ncbi:hypothetical protein NDU88_004787 [Pleurodeles waltl]|uniref:Uncharacterized protein n=1 Tax=Pleurodeles waltl TaxID=8319 RepID=A0AAV7UGJ1_PLEWA|nr:hypothetical protein NDU88_004787 [Pleurodeles waltl]